MTTTKQHPAEEQKTLIKKYRDRVGRIVTVLKDKCRNYTIQVKLFDKDGHSMLVDSKGLTVAMLCYTFRDRLSCMNELRNKYPRETREELQ